MNTILVVEDSRPTQRILRRLFESDGLQVKIASDGISGLENFRRQVPGAVVLDLKLPGLPGSELCRACKAYESSVPIVVLSANSEVQSKVLLLELGADDYVTKPFSPKELLARVRRAMRRSSIGIRDAAKSTDEAVRHELLEFGNIRIDFTSMEASRSGKKLALTMQEFKLLRFFAASPDAVLSREKLLNEVWKYDGHPTTRTVDTHILQLRQKLEPNPRSPCYFLTKHGAGYKFMPVPARLMER